MRTVKRAQIHISADFFRSCLQNINLTELVNFQDKLGQKYHIRYHLPNPKYIYHTVKVVIQKLAKTKRVKWVKQTPKMYFKSIKLPINHFRKKLDY